MKNEPAQSAKSDLPQNPQATSADQAHAAKPENAPAGNAETAKLESAVARAGELFSAESTAPANATVAGQVKRGRGRPPTHGRYCGERRKVPVAFVGTPADLPPIEGHKVGDGQAGVPVSSPVDESTIKALIEGFTGLIEDFGSGFLRAQVLKSTKDKELASEAAKGGKMSDSTRLLITTGGLECYRKYVKEFEYAPETALFGGLGLYAFGIISQAKSFTAKANEITKNEMRGSGEGQAGTRAG